MKSLILFMICFASSSVFADWKIGGKLLDVAKCEKRSCLISRVCAEDKCLAAKALANPQKGVVGEGGKNPGSAVCTEYHKGQIVLAQSEKGGTQAFCEFRDGSLLSLDGLWLW